MADSEAKKILSGLWGESGDRTDPEDPSLTPILNRENGWPPSFSTVDGDTPRRRVMNQVIRELNGAASDAMRFGGVYPYDADINYYANARCSIGADEYRSVSANGPLTTVIGPTDPGQVTWILVTKMIDVPSKIPIPVGIATGSKMIRFQWGSSSDGGSKILRFNLQWRRSGVATWTIINNVNYCFYILTGLTNGVTYEARVQAINAQGNGPWSDVGTQTAAGTVPSGGATLALRAAFGDGRVDLDWLEPDNGGLAITGYVVQWRNTSQSFSTGRQTTSTDTEETIINLTNGTAYFFRVRAVNSQGNSAWSNEDSATPEAVIVPTPPPADTVPDRITNAPNGLPCGNGGVSFAWETPDDGGQRILSYSLQWRKQGAPWLGNVITTQRGGTTITGLDAGTTYEARVHATNGIGTQTAWSPTGSATTGNDVFERETGLNVFYNGVSVRIPINGVTEWTLEDPGVYIVSGYSTGTSEPIFTLRSTTNSTLSGVSDANSTSGYDSDVYTIMSTPVDVYLQTNVADAFTLHSIAISIVKVA